MFDLVSAAYGWTDDQILDLPLFRLRAIVETINKRTMETQWWQALWLERHARSLAPFFSVMTTKKGTRKLLDAASKIELWPRRKKDADGDTFRGRPLPDYDALMRGFNARR
jgi:hypothetical protein